MSCCHIVMMSCCWLYVYKINDNSACRPCSKHSLAATNPEGPHPIMQTLAFNKSFSCLLHPILNFSLCCPCCLLIKPVSWLKLRQREVIRKMIHRSMLIGNKMPATRSKKHVHPRDLPRISMKLQSIVSVTYLVNHGNHLVKSINITFSYTSASS